MTDERAINGCTLRLQKCDVTDLEIDSFVYYARPDLKLGSGFGTAISVRGGPTIQEELDKIGPRQLTEAAITSAGEMKAKYIIHAVGPAFQEPDIEKKLSATIINALKEAESKGIERVAFPPMGAGFYGVPLATSAEITIGTIIDYLSGKSNLKEIVICPLDTREYQPFQQRLMKVPATKKEAV